MNKYSKPHTKAWAQRVASTASSSSPPSTTTAPRGRSRTRSTTSTSSGTTRRRASSLTAAPAAPARSSSCAWSWPSCRSPTCAPRWRSVCSPTSRTSAPSSPARTRRRPSPRCSTSSWPGVTPCARCAPARPICRSSRRRLALLEKQRLDVVQHRARVQEARAVDLAHLARGVDQKHLEDMRELAARLAARAVGRRHDVLAEALDERHQLARRACGEEVPAQARSLLHRTTARVVAHHCGCIARRVERQRDEAYLAVQVRRASDLFLERIEDPIRERAAVGIDARRVDEAEERDPAAGVARKRNRLAIEADDAALRRGHDPVQDVRARRRRLVVERRQHFDVVCERDRRREKKQPHSLCRPRAPSFIWCARPSFSLVKSTSNFCVSSFPSHAKPRKNCSLSAPPLSQFASSDEVM